MALDRQSIQRRDFSMSRRGYDPAEVDAHLSAVADEVVALQAAPPSGGTLASSASDHVRAIVEAAESSAAQIRTDAQNEADTTRQRAEQQAQRLSASSAAMLERLETTKRELEAVIESLRTGSDAFKADVGPIGDSTADGAETTAAAADGAGAVSVPTRAETRGPAQQSPPAAPDPEPAAEPVIAESAPDPVADAVPAADQAAPATAAAPGPGEGAAAASEDTEGARLIALHMALGGAPRDETARYLSEHYQLADRDRLLDEVYSSLEG